MFEKLFKSQQTLNWITWLTFAMVLVLVLDSYRQSKLLKFMQKPTTTPTV